MMTFKEARQRCEVFNCAIQRRDAEYRITHRAWKRGIEARAYYTDDLDDAVGTAADFDLQHRLRPDERDR